MYKVVRAHSCKNHSFVVRGTSYCIKEAYVALISAGKTQEEDRFIFPKATQSIFRSSNSAYDTLVQEERCKSYPSAQRTTNDGFQMRLFVTGRGGNSCSEPSTPSLG